MNSLRILRCVLFIGIVGNVAARVSAAPTKEEVAETAKWFDGLESPELKEKPYVEITAGRERRPRPSQNGKAGEVRWDEAPKVRGFLLGEDEKTFTLYVDGTFAEDHLPQIHGWPVSVERIGKGWPGLPPQFAVTKRALELADAVDEALAAARRPQVVQKPPPWKVSKGVALFGLARCCARAGRADLAQRIDAELPTLDGPGAWPANAAKTPFRAMIEKEVAHALMWEALLKYGEANNPLEFFVSPQESLADFSRIARDFPASAEHAEAARIADILRKMVAEEEAHAPIDYRKWDQMSREQQARETIFDLQRQQYYPSSMQEGGSPTPVETLVQLGYSAVPALLEILDDPRLTRSVVHHGRDEFPGQIVTYGECAEEAISQIAGRNFGFQISPKLTERDPAKAAARHEAMKAWWQEVQRGGLKTKLVQVVREGSGDAFEKADELRATDPAATVEAIAVGLRAVKEEVASMHLVEVLGQIPSEEATALLRSQMEHNRFARCRVDAAWFLLRRHAPNLAPTMLAEFKKWKPSDEPLSLVTMFFPESLIEFLGACGDFRAMRALQERMPHLSPRWRAEVATAALGVNLPQPVPPEVEALGERIALSALADKRPAVGAPVVDGTRVCDVAAEALADHWPKRYSFHLSDVDPTGRVILVPEAKRDEQIARIHGTEKK